MNRLFCYLIVFFCLASCMNMKEREILEIIKSWDGREIVYPSEAVFVNIDGDTILKEEISRNYRIVNYVDSLECVSCELNMGAWRNFFSLIDSLNPGKVSFLFIFHPYKKNELLLTLKRAQFAYPICIDQDDLFNKKNHFPRDKRFCTFLLNSSNKVIAIGNPIHNPKIKELYLKIIQGQPIGEEKKTIQTQVAMPETSFTFGDFPWQEAQTHSFGVKNTGNKPLVIQDVTTSCGCITVDFTKEPVQPGGTAIVKVTYKADRAEYFNKTVTVYGNAEQLPVQLHVSGNAR